MLNCVIEKVKNYINRKDFRRLFDWFIYKFDLNDKSEKLESNRKNNLHPIRPRKGEIYLIEFGQNIGKELCNTHMSVVVMYSFKLAVRMK